MPETGTIDGAPISNETSEKYLTFSLGREEYGIGILKVRELIGLLPITPVPQTPRFVRGVINLRGQVIPVVDLRLKFGLPEREYTERTSIIVVEIPGQDGRIPMGLVVDAVSEVVNIQGADVEKVSGFDSRVDAHFIKGLAKTPGGIKILLDIECILSAEELGVL